MKGTGIGKRVENELEKIYNEGNDLCGLSAHNFLPWEVSPLGAVNSEDQRKQNTCNIRNGICVGFKG